MTLDAGDGLRFDLGRESRFFFKCQRCRACCNNKRIVPDESETARLAGHLGISPERLRDRFLDADGAIRLKPNGDCAFLDERGCGIHPARPQVCRLFPLGLIRDEEGRERFSLMPLHPDCVGYLGEDETVASYLASEGVDPAPENAGVEPMEDPDTGPAGETDGGTGTKGEGGLGGRGRV
jgi:Fe-S-cluster containining protein